MKIFRAHDQTGGKAALPPRPRRRAGFTLVEMVIALFVFGLMMAGTVLLIVTVFNSSGQQSAILGNVLQASTVTSNFVNEIRNAAYGNDGSYPIAEANNQEIIFFSNFRTTGGLVDRIRYYLSGSTLYKGVIVPSGSPLGYNVGSEQVAAVETGVENGTAPVFSYYGGTYSGAGSPLTQPVNLNQITFVMVNLLVLKQSGTSASTMPVSAGAAIRNLKTNLGN